VQQDPLRSELIYISLRGSVQRVTGDGVEIAILAKSQIGGRPPKFDLDGFLGNRIRQSRNASTVAVGLQKNLAVGQSRGPERKDDPKPNCMNPSVPHVNFARV
jgi:hypothetical protein